MLRIAAVCLIGAILSGAGYVAAQGETCPAIIEEALDTTDENCASTGRNQVCYGNVDLQAEPQAGVTDFVFDAPGDIAQVSAVQNLSLSSQVAEAETWGVALMQLQANIPDTVPGQNVTFLLFGDVQIENAVSDDGAAPTTIEVMAQSGVNVRGGPSTSAGLVGGLAAGDTIIAVGRSADSAWLQILLSESDTGWVSASLVTAEGEIETLAVTDDAAGDVEPAPVLTPMQAFYFQSGIGDAPCVEAPDSGILVQTPDGVGRIEFTVNEVRVELGSTIYMQAQPDAEMTVSVVENEATVTAVGVSVDVPVGYRTRIPLDADGRASGPPSEPEPFDEARMMALPIRLLPRVFSIPSALEVTAEPPSGDVIIPQGEYEWVNTGVAAPGCPAGTAEMMAGAFAPAGPFRLSGESFDMAVLFTAAFNEPPPPNVVMGSSGPNTYTVDWTDMGGATQHGEMRVIDMNRIEGEISGGMGGCTITVSFEVTRIGD